MGFSSGPSSIPSGFNWSHYTNATVDKLLEDGQQITDPLALEAQLNGWPGVVTVGLFAARGANICLLGTPGGVERIDYVQR